MTFVLCCLISERKEPIRLYAFRPSITGLFWLSEAKLSRRRSPGAIPPVTRLLDGELITGLRPD
jgi:hypothetical protein